MSIRSFFTVFVWLMATCFGMYVSNVHANNPPQTSPSHMTPFEAIKHGNLEAIQTFIKNQGNLEQRNNSGQTPLMAAVYSGNRTIIKLLIDAGADVNAQDQLLNSPFLYAGAEGMSDVVAWCLNHGAKFDVYNRYGGSALIPAAEKGHIDVVRLLANTPYYPINHINRLGWTALMEAIVLGDGGPTQIRVVQELLHGDADVNIADKKNVSPLAHAKKLRFNEIAQLLINAGAVE